MCSASYLLPCNQNAYFHQNLSKCRAAQNKAIKPWIVPLLHLQGHSESKGMQKKISGILAIVDARDLIEDFDLLWLSWSLVRVRSFLTNIWHLKMWAHKAPCMGHFLCDPTESILALVECHRCIHFAGVTPFIIGLCAIPFSSSCHAVWPAFLFSLQVSRVLCYLLDQVHVLAFSSSRCSHAITLHHSSFLHVSS